MLRSAAHTLLSESDTTLKYLSPVLPNQPDSGDCGLGRKRTLLAIDLMTPAELWPQRSLLRSVSPKQFGASLCRRQSGGPMLVKLLRRTLGTQQYWMERHSRQRLADRIKSALTWLRNLIRQFGSYLFQWFLAKHTDGFFFNCSAWRFCRTLERQSSQNDIKMTFVKSF